MKSICIIVVVVSIAFFSCKSSSSQVTDEQMKAFEDLVENKNFKIESDWAYPQTTTATQQVLNSGLLPPGSSSGAINLIGNSNFLTISGDSIASYLPYFGERQTNVGYGGNDSAIQLEGVIENYHVAKGKKDSYTISCDAKNKSEHFKVIIKLFPNLKSYVTLTGATRNSISYSGKVKSKE
ncbi:DUF4251 domain-containing protein [Wocania ichthyoenteri]|uniref:DUF4251 domain-containing protein n=1 Tax=Wocania ichthyoenteri TaxID=1230531 RepID=UPI00053DA6C4|nr:DUF4251 domain-containing protein [Wocania ichthyoenteri]